MELEGKIINFLGDSITEGVGVENRALNRFDNRLKENCKLKRVNNYGIGGTRIGHQTQPSAKARWDLCFCGRAYDMDPEADIIIVFGGVNDYYHGDSPFGQIGDTSRKTFCGSADFLMKIIKEIYPDKTYVFLTPAHCEDDAEPSTSPNKPLGAESRVLIEYINALDCIAKSNGFHVLKMHEFLPIDPNKAEDRIKYAPDGTHFNDEGHKIIASVIENFLKSI